MDKTETLKASEHGHEQVAKQALNAWLADDAVDRVAKAITEEIGWGTFSHFNPDDMRRISRAALSALTPSPAADLLREAREAFVRELDALVRTAEASPYHDEGSRHSVKVMRDCAVRAYDASLVRIDAALAGEKNDAVG